MRIKSVSKNAAKFGRAPWRDPNARTGHEQIKICYAMKTMEVECAMDGTRGIDGPNLY